MLYSILRFINEWYALTVLWIYVLLFVVAFTLVFVFPFAPIALVFVGVAGLGIAALVSRLLTGMQSWVARRWLRQSACPRCRRSMTLLQTLEFPLTCEHCGTKFMIDGQELPPPPVEAADHSINLMEAGPSHRPLT